MIKVAAIKPKERMTQIMGGREELDYDSQPKIAAWGLQVCLASFPVSWAAPVQS